MANVMDYDLQEIKFELQNKLILGLMRLEKV